MRSVPAGRRAALVWLALAAGGCTAWRVESVPPSEVLERPNLEAVRVVRTDSGAVEIYDPTLVGDTITGHPSKLAVARVNVPLSRVKSIATQQKSIGKTLLVIGGVLGIVTVYALLQELNQGQ